MLRIFTKEVIKPFPVPDFIVLNVDNFNVWFKAKDNNAVYANEGIFLRLDKLSISHVVDYIEKCYGVKSEDASSKYDVYDFYDKIRANWISTISK